MLRASRADQSYDKKLARFASPDLLILDYLGLRPLIGDEPLNLYEIIRSRYERGAMVITFKRDTAEWCPLFSDSMLASAAMDHLLHLADVLDIDGESYRNTKNGRRTRSA